MLRRGSGLLLKQMLLRRGRRGLQKVLPGRCGRLLLKQLLLGRGMRTQLQRRRVVVIRRRRFGRLRRRRRFGNGKSHGSGQQKHDRRERREVEVEAALHGNYGQNNPGTPLREAFFLVLQSPTPQNASWISV